jgi:hypothetical protein
MEKPDQSTDRAAKNEKKRQKPQETSVHGNPRAKTGSKTYFYKKACLCPNRSRAGKTVKFQQKITQAVDAAPSRSYRPASCSAVFKTRTAKPITFFPALPASKSFVQP